MGSGYTIRPARADDQPALVAIVWKTVMASERDRDTLLAHPEAVQVPVEQLTPATACVADAAGTTAGFAVVLPRPDGDAELDGLFVDPAMQRLGIGRRLIERTKELARAMGASTLHVVAGEDALAFYRSVGFIETGVTETQFGKAPVMLLNLNKD
ncbi:MAG TPA: GNAT family N-acetyltransferase [Devosia sp.]|jgi:GNAT superfamily N-acetyltransferase|uniref:GNAT family N-acetyltransferase n=1 Tax=Devosia sp. TaxID=1871048 RepID=UPI002DDD9279|nr:GNAT family N-acetyltransferase [Devosia sp.]HEV2518670.1 GNAT family N-acetyltransferase [Devosia sp.]